MSNVAAANSFQNLLSPLDLGPFVLRNRMICTAHNPHYDSGGLIGPMQVAFHARKATGGLALSTTGATAVHPSSGNASALPLANYDDGVLPGYSALAQAMHQGGARMMVQLAHGSSSAGMLHNGPATWAPSQIVGAHSRVTPHVMTIAEIEEVIEAFGKAAARVAASGLDGVEINMFAGGMAQQFLSPLSNLRTDRYGGSLENRMRFSVEVIREVRKAIGVDRALALKISADDFLEGGMHLPQMQEVVKRIDQEARIEYYVVASGSNLGWFARVDHWPPSPASNERFIELARGIKAVTNRPVAALGRITRPEVGERLLAEGVADIVAMVRATIADPDFARKVAEGRVEEIRPCVGANSGCVDRIVAGGQMRCIHNPVIGREREWETLPKAESSRKVVVIGGGPSGMEAARVAAMRGHKVVLFEREKELGGATLILAKKPGRGELGGIPRWLASELARLCVDVRLGTAADMDMIGLEAPDVVVLAAGADRLRPALKGEAGAVPVIAAHEILEGKVTLGRNVLAYDNVGLDHGAAVVEAALDQGARAELVSPFLHPAMDFGITNTISLYRRLFEKGAVMTAHHDIARVTAKGPVLVNIYSRAERLVEGIDMVVVTTPRKPRDQMKAQFEAAGIRLFAIGDCVAPRDVETAIVEGHQAGRDI